jgi:hypothetical protein
MKWFERYAAKHAPTHKSETGFFWTLFDFRWLHIGLGVKTHSFLEARECEMPSLMYVLSGSYLEHRKNGDKGPEDYVYTDSEGRWAVHAVTQGKLRAWGPGDRQRLELFPAQRLADKLLDMPEWMKANDVEFNSEKQVWLLLVAWGKS